MDGYIIETENLTKQYGTQRSVSNLNIHVAKGKIYGLLGRNGAGKTTTMKMLLGLAGSGLLLFAVTIALICVGTNGVYMGT